MGQILLIIIALFAIGMCSSGPKKIEASGGYEVHAVVYCKELVENSLKSPSTADFPWTIQARVGAGQTYTVNSYVDAQNGFGATIRTNFFCQLKYTGDGNDDSWVVKEFKVYE